MSEDNVLEGLPVIDRQSSLSERAYQALKDSIIRGAFAPGQKLTVRSVAQALGVSTTPARDALNLLIGEGALVNTGPKTVIVPHLTQESLREITTIRLSLEGLAAERATPGFDTAAIEELEEIQAKIVRALDQSLYTDALRHNKLFHFGLYNRSGMPRLVSIIESLWIQIGPFFNSLYPEFARSKYGVSNHQWVLRGLREQEPAAVRAGMENDIRDGYRSLSRFLSEGR